VPYRPSGFTCDLKPKTEGYPETQCSARLHDVTSQKTVIFIVSEMGISHLTNIVGPIDTCPFKGILYMQLKLNSCPFKSILYMQLKLTYCRCKRYTSYATQVNHKGDQHISLRYAPKEFDCAPPPRFFIMKGELGRRERARGPVKKNWALPARAGLPKIFTLNRKDLLSVAKWLGLDLKGLICTTDR
jgi:hypothetical protein